MERILQIGVIGSAADLNYGPEAEQLAKDAGEAIAKSGFTLIFGAEKDCDSLPTVAARSARALGGMTVGITYEVSKKIYDPASASIVIPTGMVRGGGRELVQSLSNDGLLAISGGSGTLNEICVAYQANIPVVVLGSVGGWSGRLAGEYLDARQRYIFDSSDVAGDALAKLLKMIELRQGK